MIWWIIYFIYYIFSLQQCLVAHPNINLPEQRVICAARYVPQLCDKICESVKQRISLPYEYTNLRTKPRKCNYLQMGSRQLRSYQTYGIHATIIDSGIVKVTAHAQLVQVHYAFWSTITGSSDYFRNYLDEFAVWKLEESDEFVIWEETITTNKRRGRTV